MVLPSLGFNGLSLYRKRPVLLSITHNSARVSG